MQRELARRRVFVFFAAFYALALAGLIPEEGDIFLHVLDEYAIVSLSVIALILVLVWRSNKDLPKLKLQNNIILVLFVIALAFKLFGIMVEANDPADFGDEIPITIGLILTLLNRFL